MIDTNDRSRVKGAISSIDNGSAGVYYYICLILTIQLFTGKKAVHMHM